MGITASSLLDDSKSVYIKGRAEAALKDFGPYYRKQFSVARFSEVEDDLEQHKEQITQLLRQRVAPEEGEVLYEEGVLYFDETRKWKERYVVVRANYCLECHDGLETFVKGIPPRQKLLPTGGAVVTTEEKYMSMVDKCFPDDTNVKEDFAPPLSGMPGQFPVYLRLPYRRDSYFCFRQQAKQEAFLSIMSDCIRHQNQDFLKKKTCEVQAFLKAIQLYRQDRDKYESWDMLIGSDVRVMANLVMEQLLPPLQKDMLPRLKAKKTEKKRVWFATVEAAYVLIQEHLLDGLSALKDECRTSARQQEVLLHSDMDQILKCRRDLEENIRGRVSAAAEKLCSESVQPYLGSVLEELMDPVSSGFQEGRQLSEQLMDQVCQDVLLQTDNEQLRKALNNMARPNLQSCYKKIGSLQEKLQHLQDRFNFCNITGVIHSAQIDLQQLMENAAYTFEQLLHRTLQEHPENPGSSTEKIKHRVLKQYDYDSSTVRKRISREALVCITLPFIKKNLVPACKTQLQGLEQLIDSDHGNFLHVENVYEDVLLQTLDKEVTKVVKEAASLRKYNLFTDSRDLLSQSSRSSLSSPSVSTPGSPATVLAFPTKTPSLEPQPASPLAVNGLPSGAEEEPEKKDGALRSEASTEDAAVIETPLGKLEQIVGEEPPPPKTEEEVVQTVTPETQEVNVEAAPQIQEEVFSFETESVEAAGEAPAQNTDAPEAETSAAAENTKTDAEEEAAEEDPPNEPVRAAAEEETQVKSEAPSADETRVLTSEDVRLEMRRQEALRVDVSYPNSLDVSVGSESVPSDVESFEEAKAERRSSEDDEVSTTSDVLEDEVRKSLESSDDPAEEKSTRSEEAATEAVKEDVGEEAEKEEEEEKEEKEEEEEKEEAEAEDATTTSEPVKEETASVPETRPVDCIKGIRDLVMEVIEVEELVQRYPTGIPKEEEEEEE